MINKHTAYIGIGSNQGDRLANCLRAVKLLGASKGISVRRASPWYETEPIQATGPRFVNGAAEVETSLPPAALLAAMQGIAAAMGRPFTRPKNAPRTIDLDILLYGDRVRATPGLTIPHPELSKRLFVLLPLCDIAPLAVHPVEGRSIAILAKSASLAAQRPGITKL